MEAALRSDAACRSSPGPSPELEEVFARYLDSVYRFLYRHVGNREDAEDLTSEVFLKAARKLDVDRTEASVARWLFTVARTALADHWRQYYRGGALLPLDETRLEEIEQSEPRETSAGHMQQVARVMEALPDRYRRVLELRFLLGYSIMETAHEMGITPENVKVLQHRALARATQLTGGQP